MSAPCKRRFGLVLVGVGDLTGGGGAERYFADLFLTHRARAAHANEELWLITDATTITRLEAIGRCVKGERVIQVPERRFVAAFGETRRLRQISTSGGFDLLHLTQALPRHLLWLWTLPRLRSRITMNLNDDEIALRLESRPLPRGRDLEWRTYRAYFQSTAIDGYMVWYRRLAEVLPRFLAKRTSTVRAAQYCFVDVEKFKPAALKQKQIVFAGRFVSVKRPELFVAAVAIARARIPECLATWKFSMFGKGPLERALREQCHAAGLDDILTIGYAADMGSVLSTSNCFVSTQDHENFTSLAMLEAMACGNAIIARDVGQTVDFVRPGRNGLLVDSDKPEALADALVEYVSHPESHAVYAKESRRITEEEHCAENALSEFLEFWTTVSSSHAYG